MAVTSVHQCARAGGGCTVFCGRGIGGGRLQAAERECIDYEKITAGDETGSIMIQHQHQQSHGRSVGEVQATIRDLWKKG